jgi:hypothetical protein
MRRSSDGVRKPATSITVVNSLGSKSGRLTDSRRADAEPVASEVWGWQEAGDKGGAVGVEGSALGQPPQAACGAQVCAPKTPPDLRLLRGGGCDALTRQHQ